MPAVVLLLLAASCSEPSDSSGAAGTVASPPSAVPIERPSPTPSPKAKVSAHDTCVAVIGPVQKAVDLVLLFSKTDNVMTLDPDPFTAATAAVRAGHETSPPELEPDLLVVLDTMEKMTKIVRTGGSVRIDGTRFRDAALAVTLHCAELGVAPPVPSAGT